jgi:hypothetical protein
MEYSGKEKTGVVVPSPKVLTVVVPDQVFQVEFLELKTINEFAVGSPVE